MLIFSRISELRVPSQHFDVGSELFQLCESTLKQRWSDVENETKSDVGFSTLHNVDSTSGPDVETTSKQRWSNFGTHVFSCEFGEISNNTSFTEHIWTTAPIFTILFWRKTKLNLLFLEKVKQKTTEQQNW